jgi:hypothetical protein
MTATSFVIMTALAQIDYHDLPGVWQQPDTIDETEHAWRFDHLMPIFGDPNGPTLREVNAALGSRSADRAAAPRATRHERPLPGSGDGRKIAATVDIVSGIRLEFGIGAGSRPSVLFARREDQAHGLPVHDAAYAVSSLAEACTIIARLSTETEPFDFSGTYHQLTCAFGNPNPSRDHIRRS